MSHLTQEMLPGVTCPQCSILVQPRLFASVEGPGEHPGWGSSASLVQCGRQGCNFRFLVYVHFFISPSTGVVKDSIRVEAIWPPPSRRAPEGVPQEIGRDYAEACRCLAIGAYTAAALMARRVVESACIEQGAVDGVLAAKIAELGAKGKIHPIHVESATAARLIGKDAAHLLRDIKPEEVRALFDLLDHLLRDLYTTPLIQKRLREAREEGQKKA